VSEELTDRQRRYVEHVASGMASRQAAEIVGYSKSFSKVIGHRLKKHSAVKQVVEAIRKEGMKVAVYDLATAMREAEEVIAFAKQHKHPTAYFFAVRHRAHLSGLLIDRIEIATVDLTAALARAEARVLSITDALPVTSQKPIDWKPRIAGSQVSDPAADADIESGSRS
jgi:hypothetical protein